MRIFLSSTAEDLEAHRLAVAETIDHYGQLSIRMETFGARSGDSLETCCNLAAEADALIVIVAHRYGWVPQCSDGGDDSRSITWYEVDAAVDAGKDIFVYLVDPDYPWTHTKEQDRLVDPGADPAAVARAVTQLGEFKKTLSGKVRETFCGPDDLAKKVGRDLGNWLIERERGVVGPVATIDLVSAHVSGEHFADHAIVRFSLTNLAASQQKVGLHLCVKEAGQSQQVRLRKAGAVLREFDLSAELAAPGEIDLLADKPVQIVLDTRESEAFRLALHGEEGMYYACELTAKLRDLKKGVDTQVSSESFVVEFPIRSAEVLKRRRQAP